MRPKISHLLFLLMPAFLLFNQAAWGFVTGFTPCEDLPSASRQSGFCATSAAAPPNGFVGVSGLMTGYALRGPFADPFQPSSYVTYQAPIALFYPADGNCSGTALVDMVNNTGISNYLDGLGYAPPLESLRPLLGDAYLAQHGHVFASLQFQGADSLGAFPIPVGKANGYYPEEASIPVGEPSGNPQAEGVPTLFVMKDAATFLKNAGAFIPGACNSSRALAYGYSQSAVYLSVLLKMENPPELGGGYFSAGAYDGSLLFASSAGMFCAAGFLPCGPTAPEAGKAISLSTETDVQFFLAEHLRGDEQHYRSYEVAGVSHLPREIISLEGLVLGTTQNLAKISPVIRTMTGHLLGWIDGDSIPPPSVSLDTEECSLVNGGDMINVPFLEIVQPPDYYGIGLGQPLIPDDYYLDCPRGAEDGAMHGGIRLPHVVTEVSGKTVGAPLGRYSGLQTATPYQLFDVLPNTSIAFALGGVYTPFTDEEIAARYGNSNDKIEDALTGRYIGRVNSSAGYAESMGWVSEEEKIQYIHTAQDCAKGKTSTVETADLLTCHGY